MEIVILLLFYGDFEEENGGRRCKRNILYTTIEIFCISRILYLLKCFLYKLNFLMVNFFIIIATRDIKVKRCNISILGICTIHQHPYKVYQSQIYLKFKYIYVNNLSKYWRVVITKIIQRF